MGVTAGGATTAASAATMAASAAFASARFSFFDRFLPPGGDTVSAGAGTGSGATYDPTASCAVL